MNNAIHSCRMAILLVLVLGVATFARATVGQPGTLDTTFGVGGIAITPVGAATDGAAAMVLQPDGKVLIAGTCFNGLNNDFCALRYGVDGVLDHSFGSGGKVITAIGTGDDFATAIVLQPDGKVVLAGYCSGVTNFDFCALRYTAVGTPDMTFGNAGMVISQVGSGNDYAHAVALQSDGKVLLAGNCAGATNDDFCVLRYTSSGGLDSFFGTNGIVISQIGSGSDQANALALQPDGKVLLAGYCQVGLSTDFCASRYDGAGALDASFGGAGKVITAIGGGDDFASSIALQTDGKILLAGRCYNGLNNDFCALRYSPSGSPDPTFGVSGKVITPVGNSNDDAAAMTLQPDGKVLLAGSCGSFCALRYNPDGSVDTSFGSSGKVITPVGSSSSDAFALALQPDGTVLLAGSCVGASNLDFCAIRYDGGPFTIKTCSLDIDGDGRVLATTDMLVGFRVALGLSGNAVTNGIGFPAAAKRYTWSLIRGFLVTQCGMLLVQ